MDFGTIFCLVVVNTEKRKKMGWGERGKNSIPSFRETLVLK